MSKPTDAELGAELRNIACGFDPEDEDAHLLKLAAQRLESRPDLTAPVTGEIGAAMAGLAVIRDSTVRPELRDYARTAAAALQRLAQENERLKASYAEIEQAIEWHRKGAEVLQSDCAEAFDQNEKLRSRNTEMREKTVEQCAALVQAMANKLLPGPATEEGKLMRDAWLDAADNIRTLIGKETSDESQNPDR